MRGDRGGRPGANSSIALSKLPEDAGPGRWFINLSNDERVLASQPKYHAVVGLQPGVNADEKLPGNRDDCS